MGENETLGGGGKYFLHIPIRLGGVGAGWDTYLSEEDKS